MTNAAESEEKTRLSAKRPVVTRPVTKRVASEKKARP